MRKAISLLIVIMLCVLLGGCINNNMPNPVVEYGSIEEINEIAGTNLVPCTAMGKSEERFSVISDKIAQYSFTLNGKNWTVRGGKETKQDISGIHDDNNFFEENGDAIIYLNDFFIYRFFNDGMQYSIVLDDPQDVGEDLFCDVCLNMERDIKGDFLPTEDDLVGDYIDTYSQRATAHIEKEDEGLLIVVSWASSAKETTTWTMHAKLDGYQLTYGGEYITNITFDDDGNKTEEVTATNNLGYMDIEDGKLYWGGAAQEENRNCVFEKIVNE